MYFVVAGTSEIVFDELQNYSHAVSMTQITNIVESLPRIQENLQTLKNSTNELRVNASQLNDGEFLVVVIKFLFVFLLFVHVSVFAALRKVKRDMLGTLNLCMEKSTECQSLYNNITTLGSDIDFDNVSKLIVQFKKYSLTNFSCLHAVR